MHRLIPAGAGDLRQAARVVLVRLDPLRLERAVGMACVDADDGEARRLQPVVEMRAQLARLENDSPDTPLLAMRAKPGSQCFHFRRCNPLPHRFTLAIDDAYMCRLQ